MEKSKLVFLQNSVFLVSLTKRLILFTLPLLLVMIIAGCSKKKEPLSDRQVTINLAGDWEFNKELLLGMWKPVYFAYTDDGKQISERKDVAISLDCTVEITDRGTDDGLIFTFFEIYRMLYTTSSYFARLTTKQYVYIGAGMYNGAGLQYDTFNGLDNMIANTIGPDFKRVELNYGELNIYTVLEKAYGFVIRKDELFIYFTGNKNVNLLILKKN